jgi:hypothetical protein
MREGRIVEEIGRDDASEEAVMFAATGQPGGATATEGNDGD